MSCGEPISRRFESFSDALIKGVGDLTWKRKGRKAKSPIKIEEVLRYISYICISIRNREEQCVQGREKGTRKGPSRNERRPLNRYPEWVLVTHSSQFLIVFDFKSDEVKVIGFEKETLSSMSNTFAHPHDGYSHSVNTKLQGSFNKPNLPIWDFDSQWNSHCHFLVFIVSLNQKAWLPSIVIQCLCHFCL